MFKLNISFSEILKKIILSSPKIKHYYSTKYPHSKYSLDLILHEILYVLKSGVSGVTQDLPLSGNHYFGTLIGYLQMVYFKNYLIIYGIHTQGIFQWIFKLSIPLSL